MSQEMEQERIAHEKEEKQRVARLKKIKDQFKEPTSQWEKDKSEIQNLAAKEKVREAALAKAKADAEVVKSAEAARAEEADD
jgi:mannan polymerase II complex ANP1 subunit